jgi:hypothetical protein
MRKCISILNVLLAIATGAAATLGLIFSHTLHDVLPFAICILWAISAVKLLKSRCLWPWVGSLVVVCAVVLETGADTLRFLTLTWRAQSGDNSIELDPSTIGIPLFFSGLSAIGFLLFLVALLSLPFWPTTKEQMPNP